LFWGCVPEDLEIVEQEGAAITAPAYALELTGESTLLTVKDGATSICVRGPADLETNIDDVCYLAPQAAAGFTSLINQREQE
jgi:multiple sugar transport system ATP-binding protein